ncbi:tubulin like protein [Kordia sp. SMS9]|uniref:tubulin-like doman-containing protein n=1 Tax=Kordia sp. SMS9 TaxID=2282170 RepID=UPI000E0D6BD8|nr:tubulin-like doman-containing protein [Kordia sp. SMS9]AXG69987.1 tubulin like protein [Kordia sp. SMS9]
MKGYNLFIGLGGTGYDVLINIKEKLYEEYGQTQFDEIKYLYFDSDKDNISKQHLVENKGGEKININFRSSEFINISAGNTNMHEFIEVNPDVKEFSNSYGKEYNNYVGESFPRNGAGQIRMVGKLYLRKEYKEIISKIDQALKHLKSIQTVRNSAQENANLSLGGSAFNIFIFGSLAGGTGSGTCIDLPFLIQKNKSGIPVNDLNIWGYFADYSFFNGVPFSQNIRPNTFGALSELEYWKVHHRNSDFLPFEYTQAPEKYYDHIYIMQNSTKRGILNYDNMIDVASDAAISLINQNTQSAQSNSNQFSYTMQGKKRTLSSFGVSSIQLNRDRVIEYFVKKQLSRQIDYFLSPVKNTIDINDKVKNFINENNLNEGIGEVSKSINQLIEKLCPLDEDAHKELKEISFGSVETGKDVDKQIIIKKNRFVDTLIETTGNIIKENDDRNEIAKKLRVLKDTFLQQHGGIAIAKNFFRNITSQCNLMKQELVTEISVHKNNRERIESELNQLKNKMPNMKTLVRRIDKKAQEAAIKFYIKKTSDLNTDNYYSLSKEIIEIKRKEAAIKYYNFLIEVIGEFYRVEDDYTYGNLSILDRKLKDINDTVATSLQQAETQGEQGNIVSGNTVLINNRIIKLLHSQLEQETFEGQTPLLNITSIEDDLLTNESIFTIINTLIKSIYEHFKEKYTTDDGSLYYALFNENEYSIERIIIKFLSEQDIQSIFSVVQVNNQFLWQYSGVKDFPTDTGETQSTDTPLIVFFKDIKKQIENIPLKEEEYLFNELQTNLFGIFSGRSDITEVDNDNPNKIVFYLQEDKIPMFKLHNMEDMYTTFMNRNTHENSHFYTDNRIYNLNYTIMPSKADTKKWWTIACVMKLVNKSTKGYTILTVNSNSLEGTEVLVKSTQGRKDRRQAYNSFSNTESYAEEVEEHYIREVDENKQRVQTIFKEYASKIYDRKNTGKEKGSLTPEEISLLKEELQIVVTIAVDDLDINKSNLVCDNLTLRQINSILRKS